MSKTAYLFLLYKDVNHPKLWERYFAGHEDTTTIHCHAVDRTSVNTPLMLNNLIPFWVSTKWGSLGLIIAQLELLRSALRDQDATRFVLCSGSCVPIKTYEKAHELMYEQERSWVPLFHDYLQRMAKVTSIPRGHWRRNTQWVVLTRTHAERLVQFNFVSDFARCIIPDEHYVGSVLTHLGEESSLLNKPCTMAQWTKISQIQASPVEHTDVSDDLVEILRDSDSLFARKFMPNSNIAERWDDITCK